MADQSEIIYEWVTDLNRYQLISRTSLPKDLLWSYQEKFKDFQLSDIGFDKKKIINYKLNLPSEDKQKVFINFGRINELILNRIKTEFSQELVIGESHPFPKGYREYKYRLLYNPDKKDSYDIIANWIEFITYQPLQLRLDLSKVKPLPDELSGTVGQAETIRLQALAGMRTIIQSLISRKEHILVRNVIQYQNGNIVTYKPTDEYNRPIYISREFWYYSNPEENLKELSNEINLEDNFYSNLYPLENYYGWRYLSDHPLTLYAFGKISTKPPIREIEGLYLIPTRSSYNHLIQEVEMEIRALVSERYFTLDIYPRNYQILERNNTNLERASSLEVDHLSINQSGSGNYGLNNYRSIHFQVAARFGHTVKEKESLYQFDLDPDDLLLFEWCQLNETCFDSPLVQLNSSSKISESSFSQNSKNNYELRSDQDRINSENSFEMDQLQKAKIKHQSLETFSFQNPVQIRLRGPSVIQARKGTDDIELLKTWFNQTVDNILSNKLPILTIRGDWQDTLCYSCGQSGPDNESKIETMARLEYIINLAYAKLVERHPYLSSSILLLRVNQDLSIQIPLTSFQEEFEFRTEMNKILKQDDYTKWTLLSVDNLEDLVIKRWIFGKRFPKISSFGVRIKNFHGQINSHDLFYLIFNQGIDSHSLGDYPWDIKVESLMKELSQKYGESSSNLSYYLNRVLITDISYSNIRSKIHDKNLIVNRDQILRSYDSSINSIDGQNFNQIKNPETGNPITNESFSRILFYPNAWMGLFNIFPDNEKDIFSSIYEYPPSRKIIPLNFGRILAKGLLSPDTFQEEFIININLILEKTEKEEILEKINQEENLKTPINDKRYNSTINRKMTETSLSLFDISLPRMKDNDFGKLGPSENKLVQEIQKVVQWLWLEGWFISPWGDALLENSTNFPSNSDEVENSSSRGISEFISFFRLDSPLMDPMLNRADQTPEAGLAAVEHLNETLEQISRKNPQNFH